MHHPPLPPGPGLSLPVAVGTLLRPSELLRPRPNRYLGWRVEPLAGERHPSVPARPQVFQEVDEAALTQATRRCWNLLFLRRRREQRRSFPHWRAGRRIFRFCLAGSSSQFDSATRFSSPGDLPILTAFETSVTVRNAPVLLSSWQRMQSSRSLQPRGGRGFTALTSSYPRKMVAFDQSWICEF